MTAKTAKKKTTKKTSAAKTQQITPMQLLSNAMEKDVDIDKLEKLMTFQERHEYKKAERAYLAAMTKFASECPEIHKDGQADGADWRHATLGNITNIVMPLLGKYGLTYRWQQTQENEMISVRCILTHIHGHSESASITGPPDTSDDKNMVRAIASTNTLLERYTLLSVLGLSPANDDDGAGGMQASSSAKLSDQQVTEINGLLDTVQINRLGFLNWMKSKFKVNKVSDIPESGYQETVKAIHANSKPSTQQQVAQPQEQAVDF